MMELWFSDVNREAHQRLRKVDASFIEHIRQNHIPYRRDCRYCVQGGAKQRPHRRVLTPQSWTLSVDTAGPFVRSHDEHTKSARYLVVGVLTVPKVKPVPPDVPVEAPRDSDDHEAAVEELMEDAEWLSKGEPDEAADPAPNAKELDASREAWEKWRELVKSDQEAWKEEAESQHLPHSEMVDWVYVEPVASKSTAEVLTAVGRMYAAARSEGFDVRRIHTDRGREYHNASMQNMVC